jgi:N-acetylmuramoyl-L-alanine amidase
VEVLSTPTLLRIVHPAEGARLPFVRTSFVYGSADPRGRLLVNGQSVSVHPGGGWLAMVAYSTGAFSIRAELLLDGSTVTVVRKVTVAGPPIPAPVTPVTIEYVRPDLALELQPGERVPVVCKGSPGMEAYFQVKGAPGKYPMIEDAESSSRGLYRGLYIAKADHELEDSWLRVTLADKKRGSKTTLEAAGRLTLMDEHRPRVVAVSTDNAVIRAGPAMATGDKGGYIAFPPAGVRLHVVGRKGGELKVRLSETRTGWIGENEVKPLPEGTPAPQTVAGTISVDNGARSAEVRVALGQKVPFAVEPSIDGGRIDLLFFGATSNTDWIHYGGAAGAVVRQVQWFQEEADAYRVRVHAAPGGWWGYDGRYEGSTFVLELRRPPPIEDAKSSPLKGLRVAVDPGHSADRGAIGPTAMLEKDANWLIAQCLFKKLKEEGAEPFYLREADQNVTLYDRPKLAWQGKADLLVSVHTNALPEGGNPFEKNGYGVYYFHPVSYELARDIHAAYGEVIGTGGRRSRPLRDDGLHYGNLALPRTPQMPAVLTESAYIMIPEEEALLKTEAFQCDCAEAMRRGLKRFALRWRGGTFVPAPTGKKKP